nr:MAG TPA: hypothetical protein [Caudoviricetes sp.]
MKHSFKDCSPSKIRTILFHGISFYGLVMFSLETVPPVKVGRFCLTP